MDFTPRRDRARRIGEMALGSDPAVKTFATVARNRLPVTSSVRDLEQSSPARPRGV